MTNQHKFQPTGRSSFSIDLDNNAVWEKIKCRFGKLLESREDQILKNGVPNFTEEVILDIQEELNSFMAGLRDSGLLKKVPEIKIKTVENPECPHANAIMLFTQPNDLRECLGIQESKSIIYPEVPIIH